MTIAADQSRIGTMYMILIDRKRLARLMVIQGISQRELARRIGWRSHGHLNALLRGTKKSLDTDPALRIAQTLQVPVDDLFVTKVTTPTSHRDQGDAA